VIDLEKFDKVIDNPDFENHFNNWKMNKDKKEAANKYAKDFQDNYLYRIAQEAFLAGIEWVEQKKKDSIKAEDWEMDR
jgi:hypothetical protein